MGWCTIDSRLVFIIIFFLMMILFYALISLPELSTDSVDDPSNIYIDRSYDYTNNSYDFFTANLDPNIDLLKIPQDATNNYEEKLVNNYMSVSEFTHMIHVLKRILVAVLVKKGQGCSDMTGEEKEAQLPQQLSLACYTDAESIKEELIIVMTKYLIQYVKQRFKINLNPYQVINNFYVHLDLEEAIIDPLMYSQLYTMHGIQYYNEKLAKKIVDGNLHLNDVIFTTLQQRGIEVIIDNDQHIE